jgi:hypothetical protein
MSDRDRAVEEVAKKLGQSPSWVAEELLLLREGTVHSLKTEAVALCVSQSEELLRIRKAADLKRNVLIWPGRAPEFAGEWVAIPKEDFEKLRAALERP